LNPASLCPPSITWLLRSILARQAPHPNLLPFLDNGPKRLELDEATAKVDHGFVKMGGNVVYRQIDPTV